MSLASFLLVIICLGMLAYPLLHIVPSKSQKQKISLRHYASTQGIKVSVRKPTLEASLSAQYPELMNSVAYELYAADTQIKKTYTALRSKHNEGWFWLQGIRPKPSLMAQLESIYEQVPMHCWAAEINRAGSSIYWTESGTESDVDHILATLVQCNAAILKESVES